VDEALSIKNAGISNIVFHATSIYNAAEILKDNRIMTTSNIGTEAEGNVLIPRLKKHFYFLSTMRSLSGSYRPEYHKYAYFELNGDKLSEKFAGEAFDYWQHDKKYNKESEQEDRIITNLPYIEPADKYINKILIYFKTKNYAYYQEISSIDIEALESIKNSAKNLNINVYVFEDFSNLRLRNIKKSKTIEDTISDLKNEISNKNISYREIRRFPQQEINEESIFVKDMMKFKTFAEKVLSKDVDRELFNSRMWRDLKSGYYVNDIKNAVKTDIHNIRSKPEYRPYLDSFIKMMKKHKIIDLNDLFNKIKTIIESYTPYVIISAFSKNNDDNDYLHNALKNDIFRESYYNFEEVDGMWNNEVEKSIKIYYFPVYKAIELAKKYDQDAIYIHDGFEGEVYYIDRSKE
jgi:hypothetical protein